MSKLILFFQQSNTSMRNALPVPLDIWLYSLAFSLLFTCIYFILVLGVAPPSTDFTEYNAIRLNKLKDENIPNVIKIVMLGDSRLRYATFADKEMEKSLSLRLGVPVKVTRIVNNWAVFHDFSLLTTLILSVPPDLIVMQENLLSKGRAEVANKFIAGKYLFWRYFKTNSWNPGDQDQPTLQYQMSCAALNLDETVAERRERTFKWFHFNEGSLSRKEIIKFLTSTTDRNIPVLFVSIPITAIGMKGLPSPPTHLTETIWKIREQIANSNFCDIVHMNKQGRAIYSNWLTNLISHRLKINNSL